VPSMSIFSPAERKAFSSDGFVMKPNILSRSDAAILAEHYSDLFAGRFPTGLYPDEWHWREGVSLPTAVREIVNGWKTSPAVSRVALSPALGQAAAELLSWKNGTRLAQDDVLWKPVGAGGVGYHRDSAYISDQFVPRDANSVTVWIALDDADEANGAVEYAVGSHRWRIVSSNSSIGDAAGGGIDATTSSFHAADGDVAAPARAAAAAAGVSAAAMELRTVSVPVGGAIFHHQDVWHGCGAESRSHDLWVDPLPVALPRLFSRSPRRRWIETRLRSSRANLHGSRPRRALAIHLLRRDVQFRTDPEPDYIYGRYVLARGSRDVSETFFPVSWSPGGHQSKAVERLGLSGLLDAGVERPRTVVSARGVVDDGGPPPSLVPAWGRGSAIATEGGQQRGDSSGAGAHAALDAMLDAWRRQGCSASEEGERW
jgi:phytanoyl-CoA hydroxylase